MTVFASFDGYGFIHHRALNDFSALREAMQLVSDHPERTHILEGDICWDFSQGNNAFYFRHPSFVVDTLSAKKIEQRHGDKTLLSLSDLLPIKSTNAYLVIELKVGRGCWKTAIISLIKTLEEHFAGRYWIDGFSLPMLEYVKKISPKTTVTLHTEFVNKGHVLIAAPEWPTVKIRKLADLGAIDGVAIRRRGSEKFMTRACADVQSAGKALLLSRLHNLREFECSKLWGANAGYMHWNFEELLKFNDEIDTRRELSGRSNT